MSAAGGDGDWRCPGPGRAMIRQRSGPGGRGAPGSCIPRGTCARSSPPSPLAGVGGGRLGIPPGGREEARPGWARGGGAGQPPAQGWVPRGAAPSGRNCVCACVGVRVCSSRGGSSWNEIQQRPSSGGEPEPGPGPGPVPVPVPHKAEPPQPPAFPGAGGRRPRMEDGARPAAAAVSLRPPRPRPGLPGGSSRGRYQGCGGLALPSPHPARGWSLPPRPPPRSRGPGALPLAPRCLPGHL